MPWYFYIITFIFGTILGSFINVLAFRINTGMTLGGRSKCLSCRKVLGWKELVPLASYFALRGKCKGCCTPIDPQYPIVETISGIGFMAIVASFWWLTDGYTAKYVFTVLFWTTLFLTSLFISIYDLKHKIIYTPALYIFLALSFIAVFFSEFSHNVLVLDGFDFTIMPIFSGLVVVLPFFLLWLYSSGTWIGFGDLELMFGTGMLLGLRAGFSAIILGFWIAAFMVIAIGVSYHIMHRRQKKESKLDQVLHPKREIPFAPFLLLGLFLVGALGMDIFGFIGRI